MTADRPRGLSIEDATELNTSHPGGAVARNARVDELEQKYADNPAALREISVFMGNREYLEQIDRYNAAMRDGDLKAQREVEEWISEHYPDINPGVGLE